MAEEAALKPEAKSSPAKLVLVILLGAAVLVAASIGTVFFMMKNMGMIGGESGGGHGGEGAEKGPAIYQTLDPPFVVNFKDRGRNRFLQISMQAMTRDETVVADLIQHTPLIRNNILLLLSSQDAEVLYSNEGKEQLRAKVLAELNALLEKETGKAGAVEALYFTSFVTQ